MQISVQSETNSLHRVGSSGATKAATPSKARGFLPPPSAHTSSICYHARCLFTRKTRSSPTRFSATVSQVVVSPGGSRFPLISLRQYRNDPDVWQWGIYLGRMPLAPSTFIKYKQFHTLLSSRDLVVFTTSHLGFCQVYLPLSPFWPSLVDCLVFVARGREAYHAEGGTNK